MRQKCAKEDIMATTKKATQKATETNVKVSYYGNREAMLTAATLRGNLGRPLRSRGFFCLTAERKSEVTKGLKKLVGPDVKIEYSNPIVCRKRKGIVAPIDGETRIWVGVCKAPKKATAEEPKAPKKAAKAKAAKEKVSESDEIAALKEQIAQMQEALNTMAKAL